MSSTVDRPALDLRTQAFVDGAYVDAVSGETFDCVNPATGETLAAVAACDEADVDRAVRGARAAFESGVWSRGAPKERKRVLRRLADLIDEHRDELALLETLDTGKPIRDSTRVDLPLAAECIAYYAEAIDKVYDEIAPTDPSKVVMIVREPVGVVGAVVPWNFPLMMAAWKVGPALAAGNSVVLKPAEQSPLTALRLAELAAEAGVPEGVLQVVPGFGETAGQAIGRHMDVDLVAFTGSSEVGKFFLRYSGESNMKRLALECGGKSPHIVIDRPRRVRALRRHAQPADARPRQPRRRRAPARLRARRTRTAPRSAPASSSRCSGSPSSRRAARSSILLTDGESNVHDIDEDTAIDDAVKAGVKVYTIGAGTTGVAPIRVDRGDGRSELMQMQVSIDETMLRKIADKTGGQYFRATDNASLAHDLQADRQARAHDDRGGAVHRVPPVLRRASSSPRWRCRRSRSLLRGTRAAEVAVNCFDWHFVDARAHPPRVGSRSRSSAVLVVLELRARGALAAFLSPVMQRRLTAQASFERTRRCGSALVLGCLMLAASAR